MNLNGIGTYPKRVHGTRPSPLPPPLCLLRLLRLHRPGPVPARSPALPCGGEKLFRRYARGGGSEGVGPAGAVTATPSKNGVWAFVELVVPLDLPIHTRFLEQINTSASYVAPRLRSTSLIQLGSSDN
jgi:hypothetical protein